MGILAKFAGIIVKKHEYVNNDCDVAFSGIVDSRGNELTARYPNEYVIRDDGLYRLSDGELKRVGKDIEVWGLRHKSVEQRCAIDALMNDNIRLVTISGKAGTGKTLLAIAAGLEKVTNDNVYRKLLVSRPIVPMGQDLGYLPGTVEEKLGPWMKPIFDNIDFLFTGQNMKGTGSYWGDLVRQGLLEMEALTYIRGRSIPYQYIIIDEAQNLTKHEVKTIISRAGEGTKIIMTGDVNQIDNPKLDSINNGLSYVIDKFKDQPIAAHISFSKCERSELADVASEIL